MKQICIFLASITSLFSMYLGVVILLWVYSNNSSDKQHTFFPEIHAKIDVYQNNAGSLQRYENEGVWFWSSGEYYNTSYNFTRLSLQGEPSPLSKDITNIVTTITRESH